MQHLVRIVLMMLVMVSCSTKEKSIRDTHFDISSLQSRIDEFRTVEVNGGKITLRTITLYDTSREDRPVVSVIEERDSVFVEAVVRDTTVTARTESHKEFSKTKEETKASDGRIVIIVVSLIVLLLVGIVYRIIVK